MLRASQSYKLNAALETGGDVSDFQISSTGSRVVYRSDQNTDEVFELFSVVIGGATPTKLNGALAAGGDVASYQISPDGSRVVYLADQNTDGVLELFSVPIGGGTAARLNGSLVAGGQIDNSFNYGFRISPDSSRVVYKADQITNQVFELFGVPITGGTPIKLNSTLPSGGYLWGYRISPDSGRVVYTGDQNTFGVTEIFSVPIVGGTPTKLNSTLVTNGWVEWDRFHICPDGTRVVYVAAQNAVYMDEIFSVSISGGTVQKLNGSLVPEGDVDAFEISPDGSRVVYRADQITDEVFELFSVPSGGGTALKINGPLVTGGYLWNFTINQDGSRVVYTANQATADVTEIFSVPITGGTVVRLNGTLVTGGSVWPHDYQISSDGNRVVYHADQNTNDVWEIFSTPVAASTPVKLNGTMVSGGDVDDTFNQPFKISSDGSRVVYRADLNTVSVDELFSVPIAGGTSIKLNCTQLAGGDVGTFQISPDNSRVIYQADQNADEVYELFVARGKERWVASGGTWEMSSNWEFGFIPDLSTDAVIDASAVVTATDGVTARVVDTLTIGGGGGTSVLDLLSDAGVAATDGITLLSGGVIRGDGSVSCGGLALAVPSGAELSAANGDRLRVTSGTLTNAGRIEALGNAFTPAELDFSGAATNQTSTGLITGHDSTLRFRANLTNAGYLTFGRGFNDLFGEISNQGSGRILVSGGATTIFYDDVLNGGVIQASASSGLTSTAVFFGGFSGNGVTGSGVVFLEGDTRPGFSSGLMTFGGDVNLGSFSTLHIELGGTNPSTQYDRLAVTGHLSLSGILEVSLINSFTPTAGMQFDVWNAASFQGEFSMITLPTLSAGLFWHLSRLPSEGILEIGVTPESYADYAKLHGLTTPANSDQDRDGLANLVEYALALNPRFADSAGPGVPRFMKSGSTDLFFFDMPTLSSPDLQLEIQTTIDLANWTTLATRTSGAPWTGPSPPFLTPVASGMETVTLSVADAGAARRLYRLKTRLVP